MHADGSVEIGVGHPHGCRRRATRGEAGDIDAARRDREVAHDLLRNTSNERGFAVAALLFMPLNQFQHRDGLADAGC